MAIPSDLAKELSPGTSEWLGDHLDTVARRIVAEARAANVRGGILDPMLVADATKNYAPGDEIPPNMEQRLRWWESLTVVCAALTLTFGLLGFFLARSQTAGVANTASGWLDIAKVFAGAIVGSAGSTAVTKARSAARNVRPLSPKPEMTPNPS